DATGQYSFQQLHGPKKYQVQFTLPALYSGFSPKNAVGATSATDSDVDTAGKTDIFTLGVKENNQTIDAGIIPRRASIGNYVWLDANQNGLQDMDEKGIENVRVELYTVDSLGNSTYLSEQLTDLQGAYLFENLDPTVFYVLKFNKPAEYDVTTAKINGLGNHQTDSDINEISGWTETIRLEYGENNQTIDAGYIMPDTIIGDYVFADLNEDGLQDSLEPGISGVKVELLNSFDIPVADGNGNFVVLTDNAGKYNFVKLHGPGAYKVKFNLPATYSGFSPRSTNLLENAIDSNANSNGITDIINIEAKQKDQTIDAGIIPKRASIGNYVWLDSNKDGLQNEGEQPLANIEVNLYTTINKTKTLVATKQTDANGQYLFDNLFPSPKYIVEFIAPREYDITATNSGGSGNNSIDSDINQVTGQTAEIMLAYGQVYLDADAGFITPNAQLGDYVFEDRNQNGQQDSNEPGVGNVKVELFDEFSNPIKDANNLDTILTNEQGKYRFIGLHGGKNYRLKFTLPAAYDSFTTQMAGITNQEIDSDADQTGQTNLISLAISEENLTIDAGVIPGLASIGDYTWLDENENGLQDSNEVGIEGVKVELYTINQGIKTQHATTISDSQGKYLFEKLDPNKIYQIRFIRPNGYDITAPQSLNQEVNSDAEQESGWTQEINLAYKEKNLTIDAGFVRPESMLGDFVFADTNENGLQDLGERGVLGVRVMLFDELGNPIADGKGKNETTTDEFGYYSFVNLHGETRYKLKFILPPEFKAFTQKGTAENLDNVDSDVDQDGFTEIIAVDVQEHKLTIDAGLLIRHASIGNYVWLDTNNNGIQDSNELGIANVKVTLTDEQNNSIEVTTNIRGRYLFENLIPGKYCITIEKPAGYGWTVRQAGTNSENDNDFDDTNGTQCYTLAPGEENLTADGGLIQIIRTVGNVGLYCVAEGIAGLKPVKGLKVKLTRIEEQNEVNSLAINKDNPEFFAESDDAGNISFGTIPKGRYQYEITGYPQNYFEQLGKEIPVREVTITGDHLGTHILNALHLEINRCFEFGNRVWEDTNKNGIQDEGEKGINGVEVTLFDENDNPINNDLGAQIQDVSINKENFAKPVGKSYEKENGIYRIQVKRPGKYKVKFKIPTGYNITQKNSGTDDKLDSNVNPQTAISDIIELTAGDPWKYTLDLGLYKNEQTPEETTKPQGEATKPAAETTAPQNGKELPTTGERIIETILSATIIVISSVILLLIKKLKLSKK
ncbi:MAG: SdrD B-like domain-containing protein, partial [Culicoidibacterales bacterium]